MRVIIEAGGERVGLDLPMAVEEVSFKQFCEFRTKERDFWKFCEEFRKEGEDEREMNGEEEAEMYLKLEEAVVVFGGEGVRSLPVARDGDNYQEMIDRGFQLKLGDEITLLRYYAHMVGLIQSYVPEEIPAEFEWVDERSGVYKLKKVEVARAMFGLSITAGEAITVLEYQRRAGMAENRGLAEVGNIEFSLGMTEVAVLLRRKGERLPASKVERDRFIERRRKVFEGMSLRDVLDMRFFFINTLLEYGTIPNTSFFGKAHLTPDEGR